MFAPGIVARTSSNKHDGQKGRGRDMARSKYPYGQNGCLEKRPYKGAPSWSGASTSSPDEGTGLDSHWVIMQAKGCQNLGVFLLSRNGKLGTHTSAWPETS